MQAPSLFGAASQIQLTKRLDLIANNIANSSTPGYKAEGRLFRDYMQKVGTTKKAEPQDLYRDYKAGGLSRTGNTLDVAIAGEGFFQVETPEGTRYTRNGRFSIDNDGNLISSGGQKVLDDGGAPITFTGTDTDIEITSAGEIQAGGTTLAKLGVVKFANPQDLVRAGGGLLFAGTQVPEPTEAAITQGTVEESNVTPVLEITTMMQVMRAYQSAQQIAEAEHERIRRAIQVLSQAR